MTTEQERYFHLRCEHCGHDVVLPTRPYPGDHDAFNGFIGNWKDAHGDPHVYLVPSERPLPAWEPKSPHLDCSRKD